MLDVAAFAALGKQTQVHPNRSRSAARQTQCQRQSGRHGQSQEEDAGALLQAGEALGKQLSAAELQLEAVQEKVNALQMELPNILHASVPEGRDESANVEVRRWGTPKRFSFEASKDHVALGERLGMDFEAASKISGARFVVMKGAPRKTASCASAVHARFAHARARLHRGVRAISGAWHRFGGYRATAEVRAGLVCGERRPRLLLDTHLRGAAHPSGTR